MGLNIRGLSHGDHMDGSAQMVELIEPLYKAAGLEQEFATRFGSRENWLEFMKDCPNDIPKYFSTITNVLQTPEALQKMAYAYVIHRAKQGMIAGEGEFAPQSHTKKLRMEEAVEAVQKGLDQGEKETGLHIKLKLGIVRDLGGEEAIKVARLAVKYKTMLDLCCTEPGHPPRDFIEAYDIANENDVPTDVHVEWVEKEPVETYWQRLTDNLEDALFLLNAKSIGHAPCLGYVMDHRPDILKHVVDKQIRITMCPLSNLTLKHIENIGQLRIPELLDAGVWLTLNPDDDLFLPEMKEVIKQCERRYDFTEIQCRQLEENAIRPLGTRF